MIFDEANFPELPGKWTYSLVENACDNLPLRQKILVKDYQQTGYLPVIDQGAALIGGYIYDGEKKVTDDLPVIVFGDHTRAIKYIDFHFAAGADGIKVLKPYSFFQPKLFYYFLRAIKLPDKGYARHFQYLRKSKIALPPLGEQNRIADKLDSLLYKVGICQEHLERVPQIIERFRQSVLAEAVSGRLTEEWREENNSGEIEIKNFSFPSSWKIQSFDDTLDLIDGDRGPNYPKRNDYLEGGCCVFLSTKNVREFGFKFDEVVFITEEKHKILRSGTLERGDVVVTTRGTLGNVAHYDEIVPFDVVRINSGMLILRKKQDNILGKFLVICIASSFFKTQLEEKRTGTAQPQIPAKALKTFFLPLPPIDEQQEIINRVEKLFSFAGHVDTRYQAGKDCVDLLTPSLLAKAFRGELVEQDPHDEPASVLLERIKAEREATSTRKPPKSTRSDKPRREKLTEKSVKEAIQSFPNSRFSIEELQEKVSGDYEQLKRILFNLISEDQPIIAQVFDRDAQAMRFIRRQQ